MHSSVQVFVVEASTRERERRKGSEDEKGIASIPERESYVWGRGRLEAQPTTATAYTSTPAHAQSDTQEGGQACV